MNPRGRNKVGAFQDRMYVLVRTIQTYTTKWARQGAVVGGHRHQRAHADTNQLSRANANEIRQAAVHPQYVITLVVNNDEISDRIENLDPVAIRLIHPRE